MSKYKLFLLIVFVAALVWSGINPPVGQADWLLENTPMFAAVVGLIIFARYLKLSNFSYTLIVIYLMFPLLASHYGVMGVSLGNTIGDFLGTTRNMYDKLTHFLFGFLLFYPIYELIVSVNKKEGGWNYFITLETIFTLSAGYEIFEWLSAITVNPILAASFLGSQGDIFDTPTDMASAIMGALIAMLILFLYKKYRKNKN